MRAHAHIKPHAHHIHMYLCRERDATRTFLYRPSVCSCMGH